MVLSDECEPVSVGRQTPEPMLKTVLSDECEPVSARTTKLLFMPRRDRATRQERRRG
jgi:hypothetical protein